MIRKLLFIAFVGINGPLLAQDIHFSQYFLSPVATAVSNTGNHDGVLRVFGNYRTQWAAISQDPYVTPAIGADYNYYLNKIDKVSGGIYIINDQSGGYGGLQVTKALLSAAYHKKLFGHNLHAGIQGGYILKSINKNKETFPNQFDQQTGYFNNQNQFLQNNETNLNNNVGFVDFNAGLGWDNVYGNLMPYGNYTIFHITQPNGSFLKNQNEYIRLRHLFNGGVKIQLGTKYMVHPSFNYTFMGRASEFNLGGNFHFNLDNKVKSKKYVYAGLYTRLTLGQNQRFDQAGLSDAVYPAFGVGFGDLQVGVNYDVNVSNLKSTTSNRGAFEFAIIYTFYENKLRKQLIPCDRL